MNSTALSSSSLILSSASSSLLLNLSVELFWTSMVAQMVKNACNAGDSGSVPALGRSPGERNGNPLQDSCLENFMDRGAWRTTFSGLQRVRDTTEQLTVENGWYKDLTLDENR